MSVHDKLARLGRPRSLGDHYAALDRGLTREGFQANGYDAGPHLMRCTVTDASGRIVDECLVPCAGMSASLKRDLVLVSCLDMIASLARFEHNARRSKVRKFAAVIHSHHVGPFEAKNEREARKVLREKENVKRLPPGTFVGVQTGRAFNNNPGAGDYEVLSFVDEHGEFVENAAAKRGGLVRLQREDVEPVATTTKRSRSGPKVKFFAMVSARNIAPFKADSIDEAKRIVKEKLGIHKRGRLPDYVSVYEVA